MAATRLLALFLLLIWAPPGSAQEPRLTFGDGRNDTCEIFSGGCVPFTYWIVVTGLEHAVKELEFSVELPEGVSFVCMAVPHGSLEVVGNNYHFTFEECLEPAERVRLFEFFPDYDVNQKGEACFGPAEPSRLGVEVPAYRTCDGELGVLSPWSPPECSPIEGCTAMTLATRGAAEQISWGMTKSQY